MNSLLVDKDGKIRNFSGFKKEVFKVHKKYNRDYLQAEFQTAKRSAQAARQWKTYDANKDLFPNLKYRTVGDDRVRDEHAALDGVIKPVDDNFWNTYYPPNGWRCRCSVTPTSEGGTKDKISEPIEESFANNVGKTNRAFLETKHPYFVIPKSDKTGVERKINGLLAIHSAKRVIKFAKERIVGNRYRTVDKKTFEMSVTNIKTIVNKAHKDRVGRNNLLYNLKETLKKATFIKTLAETKNRSKYIEWNYYKVETLEGTYIINIAKMKDGRFRLHAITDKVPK
jgi:SPP1 gp7 family putative phage head morphogenesis protein